jgi:hypothetical protein
MRCNRVLTQKDIDYIEDSFSAKVEPVCRHCHYRLIILIGFSVPFWHGWRKVK